MKEKSSASLVYSITDYLSFKNLANLTSQVLNYEKLTKAASREAKKGAEKMLKLREMPPINLEEMNKAIKRLIDSNDPKTEEKVVAVPTQRKKILVEGLEKLKAEEKVWKLTEAMDQASSSLIQSIVLADLFKVLYECPEVRHKVHRSNFRLIPNLLSLRTAAEARHDKRLVGSINECLSLLGHIEPSDIKRRGINILSLDGGGWLFNLIVVKFMKYDY